MCDPCTVTLADPVLRRLVGLITLSDATSADNASVLLPINCPTLNDIRRLPIAPCEV